MRTLWDMRDLWSYILIFVTTQLARTFAGRTGFRSGRVSLEPIRSLVPSSFNPERILNRVAELGVKRSNPSCIRAVARYPMQTTTTMTTTTTTTTMTATMVVGTVSQDLRHLVSVLFVVHPGVPTLAQQRQGDRFVIFQVHMAKSTERIMQFVIQHITRVFARERKERLYRYT